MMSAPHRSNHRPGNGDPCHAASRWPSGRLGVEEDEEEKPSNKAEPAATPKDSKVEQLCDWMAAHCGLDSKAVAKYAEALVGEGVDQPSDLADVDDADWPSSIKTLHLKKIKAAVAKGDFDVPEPEGAMDQDDEVSPTRPHRTGLSAPCACFAPSAQVRHGEPAIADDAVPVDEVVADKEPTVADKEPAVAAVEDDAVRAKETKEKQHAEIVAKRHKAALAKKKRD